MHPGATAARRGMTPVVAIALLLGMTVAASGGAYTFISQVQQEGLDEASTSLRTSVSVRSVRCEDTVVAIGLSNTGDAELAASSASAYLYRDGDLLDSMDKDVSAAAVLQPGGFSELELPFTTYLEPGTRYTVEVRFDDADYAVEQTCQARGADLIGYWNFDAKDVEGPRDSASGNDGTLNGDTDGTLTNFDFDADSGWVDGRIGSGALTFDGTDDYVNLQNVGLDLVGSNLFTVSLWFRTTATNGTMFRQDDQDVNLDATTARIDSGGHLCLQVFDQAQCTSQRYDDGEWHMATLVRSGPSAKEHYVDGELYSSIDTGGSNNDGNADVYLGAKYDPVANHFDGTVDHVRIYSRALSAPEISALYEGDDIRTGLPGEWPLDEESGTTVHDTSQWVDGKHGLGMEFDASDYYIKTANPVDYAGPMTMLVWILPNASDPDWDSSPSRRNIFQDDVVDFDQKVNNNIAITVNGVVVGDVNDNTYDYPEDQWSLAGFRYDGATLELIRDGTVIDSAPLGSLPAPTVQGWFGAETGGGRYWGGIMDEFRVYNRSLSDAELQVLYSGTR